jgi:hypothetical protein
MKFVITSDFFMSQVLGGGEINDEELVLLLRSKGFSVVKRNSHDVSVEFIRNNKDCCFIVSNFINLGADEKKELMNCQYIIYEHDHKYLKNRNPGVYENFTAPKSEIVNFDFYKKARRILTQSTFHQSIIHSNLNLNNIANLSGNLWSLKSIDLMKKMAKSKKNNYCAIMKSDTPHKNQFEAIKYCELKKKEYQLIHSNSYTDFLSQLGRSNQFVFFPKTTETLSRVVVEARMMNVKVTTNANVGATKEPWFKLKGIDLIEKVEEMRITIPEIVIRSFE